MTTKNRKPETKQQIILELWRQTGKESAGASELCLIQKGLLERLGGGVAEGLASIARTLADDGVRLQHPEILAADVRWRQDSWLFSAEDLNLETLEAATALIEKIERLRREFEGDDARLAHLRGSVRQIKEELVLLAKKRQLAQEVSQWLTVWLQNPQIFAEWLELRRSTAEFQERFGQ
jgi:hypothetical protein